MSTKENGSDATTEIRGDIVRARADMARTVGQIEERLSPAHLKGHMTDLSDAVVGQYHEVKDHLKSDLRSELSEAKEVVKDELREAKAAVSEEIQNVKTVAYDATVGKVQNMAHDASETVRDAGTTFLDTIKRNPIPAVLATVGIGWLIMSARRPAPRKLASGVEDGGWRVREKVGDLAHRAGDRLGHLASDVRGGAVEAAHDARDATVHAAEGARDVAHQVAQGTRHIAEEARDAGRAAVQGAERGFGHALDVNPLAVGAVALAIGAAVGLALPHTEREDEWMGETKDRLLSRAKGMAQGAATDAMRQVEDAAHGAIHQAETKLGEKVEKLGVTDGASRSNGRLEAMRSPSPTQPT